MAAMGEAIAVADEDAANAISAGNISSRSVALYENGHRPAHNKTCDSECLQAAQPSAAAATCVSAFYRAHLAGLMSALGTERIVGRPNFTMELESAMDDITEPCHQLMSSGSSADDALALPSSAKANGDLGVSWPISALLQKASERVYAPPVRWLGIENAGENFVSTLWRFACSECKEVASHASQARSTASMTTIARLQGSLHDERCCDRERIDDSFFAYMPARPIDIKTGGLALMLRDPARRLLSAYLYAAATNASKDAHGEARGVMSLDEWMRDRQHYGCQTNMLVGRACSQAAAANAAENGVEVAPWQEPTTAEVQLAVRMVSGPHVQFVGVYEHWDESVALFHAVFTGGHNFDRSADLSPPQVLDDLNRTSVLMKDMRKHGVALTDEADQAVYDQGRARFLRDLRTYGLVQ